MGHRGCDATESILREHFIWDDMQNDIKVFVKGCVHCLITRTGETIPPPMGKMRSSTAISSVGEVDATICNFT